MRMLMDAMLRRLERPAAISKRAFPTSSTGRARVEVESLLDYDVTCVHRRMRRAATATASR